MGSATGRASDRGLAARSRLALRCAARRTRLLRASTILRTVCGAMRRALRVPGIRSALLFALTTWGGPTLSAGLEPREGATGSRAHRPRVALIYNHLAPAQPISGDAPRYRILNARSRHPHWRKPATTWSQLFSPRDYPAARSDSRSRSTRPSSLSRSSPGADDGGENDHASAIANTNRARPPPKDAGALYQLARSTPLWGGTEAATHIDAPRLVRDATRRQMRRALEKIKKSSISYPVEKQISSLLPSMIQMIT